MGRQESKREDSRFIRQFASRSSSDNLSPETNETLELNRPLRLSIIEGALAEPDDTDNPITLLELHQAIA